MVKRECLRYGHLIALYGGLGAGAKWKEEFFSISYVEYFASTALRFGALEDEISNRGCILFDLVEGFFCSLLFLHTLCGLLGFWSSS